MGSTNQSALMTMNLPLAQIQPSRLNPRRYFDEGKLAELAASLKEHGLLEPLVVRVSVDGVSELRPAEIIAGERRWRAAALAGLSEVPCVVRELDDGQAAEAMLVENLQRADLTPIEEARAFQAWIEARGKAHPEADRPNYPKDLAERLSKSEDYIRERLRLAQLAESVQAQVESGAIRLKEALLLSRVATRKDQVELAKQAAAGELTPHLLARAADRVVVHLGHAPFGLGDLAAQRLGGGVPACDGCQHRVVDGLLPPAPRGTSPALGACSRPECFRSKTVRYVEVELGAKVVAKEPKGSHQIYSEGGWKASCPGCSEHLVEVNKSFPPYQFCRLCTVSWLEHERAGFKQKAGSNRAEIAEKAREKARRKKEAEKEKARREAHRAASEAAFAWLQTQPAARLGQWVVEAMAGHSRQDQIAAAGKLLGLEGDRGKLGKGVCALAKAAQGGADLSRLLAAMIAGWECGESMSPWEKGAGPAVEYCKRLGIQLDAPAKPKEQLAKKSKLKGGKKGAGKGAKG